LNQKNAEQTSPLFKPMDYVTVIKLQVVLLQTRQSFKYVVVETMKKKIPGKSQLVYM